MLAMYNSTTLKYWEWGFFKAVTIRHSYKIIIKINTCNLFTHLSLFTIKILLLLPGRNTSIISIFSEINNWQKSSILINPRLLVLPVLLSYKCSQNTVGNLFGEICTFVVEIYLSAAEIKVLLMLLKTRLISESFSKSSIDKILSVVQKTSFKWKHWLKLLFIHPKRKNCLHFCR